MPITPADKTWIEDNFKWLFEQFGHASFLRNEIATTALDYFPYKIKMDDHRPLEVLTQKMCANMDIDSESVYLEIIINEEQHLLPYAIGSYYENIDFEGGELSFQIVLQLTPLSNKESIIYALAHSLAYIKLLGENRISAAEDDYNYLTDLSILFWGFGILGANQAFLIQKGFFDGNPYMPFTMVNRGAYLPVEMWAYGLALYAKLKAIEPKTLLPYMAKEVKREFKKFIKDLRKEDFESKLQEWESPGVPADPVARNLLPQEVQQQFQVLDQAIEQDAFPQAWLDRARLNKRFGLRGPALQDLHYLIKKGQLREQAHLEKAKIALDLDLYQDAYAQLEALSPEARNWPESLYTFSTFYWNTDNRDKAAALLDQVLMQVPTHAEANWSKGMTHFWGKDYEKALEHLNQAIKTDPLKPFFWVHRAKIHVLNKNWQAASEDIHTALGLDKSLAEAYTGRGVLRRKEKRHEAAIQDFETAQRLEPHRHYAQWHKSVSEQLMEEEIWILVGEFDTMEDAFPYRLQLQELGIKHRFRDPLKGNMPANTDGGKWLYVRDEKVEEAMDILTEGWW